MTNVHLWLLGLMLSSVMAFALRRLWKWYRSQRQVLPTGRQTIFVETNGREVEILLDPTAARKANKVNRRRFWAMFTFLLVRLMGKRGRIWLAKKEAQAMAEIHRVETPSYIPPEPAREQFLRRLDQAMEFCATRLAHLLRNRWAERAPIREARALNRERDIADAAAEITERGEGSLWHSRKLWERVGMGLLIIATAFLLSKQYWLPGGLTAALTLVLRFILWRQSRSRRARLTHPKTEAEAETDEPKSKAVLATALCVLVLGLLAGFWFGWIFSHPILLGLHIACSLSFTWLCAWALKGPGKYSRTFRTLVPIFVLAVWIVVVGNTIQAIQHDNLMRSSQADIQVSSGSTITPVNPAPTQLHAGEEEKQ